MVDLFEVTDAVDTQELKTLIEKHFNYTGSTVAKFVLDNWEEQSKNFVKVFPKDYQRVLAELAENNGDESNKTETLSKGEIVV